MKVSGSGDFFDNSVLDAILCPTSKPYGKEVLSGQKRMTNP